MKFQKGHYFNRLDQLSFKFVVTYKNSPSRVKPFLQIDCKQKLLNAFLKFILYSIPLKTFATNKNLSNF